MPSISRRDLARGAAWSVPAVAASSAVPVYAASPNNEPGKVVAVLWSNTFSDTGQGKTTGTDRHYHPWIIYPTAMTTGGNNLSVTNSTPASSLGSAQKGTGTLAPAASDAKGYKVPTGSGKQINIVIENIGETGQQGSDEYADVPRISQDDVPKGTRYTRGTGVNPAWPSLVVRDTGWYTVTTGTRSTSNENHWFGVRSKGSNGRTRWDLSLTVNKDFSSPKDGADAVTFDLFWPSRMPVRFPKVISARVQYRVTVTSEWGTVTYVTSAI